MEGEISNFIKVWLSVLVSLVYCYIIGKTISKGPLRLLLVLPIVCLFLFLPLKLYSLHIGGATAFFIAWIANFKLLLFAIGKGPLSSDPSISLRHFVALACLPIKIHPKPSAKKSHQNGINKENPFPKQPQVLPFLNYAAKGLLMATIVKIYDYTELIHPKILWLLYCCHIYIFLELMLVVVGVLARALIGLELEPHFNEPYLSTSLQDFWGRRWNLMVTSILRPSVYEPIRNLFTCVIGRELAAFPAIIATFLVSALMHELIFYYLGRKKPNWTVSLFFLLHGFCLMVEIVLKKLLRGRFELPRLISGILTIGFVILTCFWLFFPQFLLFNADVRMLEEYSALGSFLKNISGTFIH